MDLWAKALEQTQRDPRHAVKPNVLITLGDSEATSSSFIRGLQIYAHGGDATNDDLFEASKGAGWLDCATVPMRHIRNDQISSHAYTYIVNDKQIAHEYLGKKLIQHWLQGGLSTTAVVIVVNPAKMLNAYEQASDWANIVTGLVGDTISHVEDEADSQRLYLELGDLTADMAYGDTIALPQDPVQSARQEFLFYKLRSLAAKHGASMLSLEADPDHPNWAKLFASLSELMMGDTSTIEKTLTPLQRLYVGVGQDSEEELQAQAKKNGLDLSTPVQSTLQDEGEDKREEEITAGMSIPVRSFTSFLAAIGSGSGSKAPPARTTTTVRSQTSRELSGRQPGSLEGRPPSHRRREAGEASRRVAVESPKAAVDAGTETAKRDTETAKRDTETAKRDTETTKRDTETARHDTETARHAPETAPVKKEKSTETVRKERDLARETSPPTTKRETETARHDTETARQETETARQEMEEVARSDSSKTAGSDHVIKVSKPSREVSSSPSSREEAVRTKHVSIELNEAKGRTSSDEKQDTNRSSTSLTPPRAAIKSSLRKEPRSTEGEVSKELRSGESSKGELKSGESDSSPKPPGKRRESVRSSLLKGLIKK